MATSQASQFKCPNCGARYQVVSVEAEPVTVEELTCLRCVAALRGRDGRFGLKCFLLENPQSATWRRRAV